MTQAVRLVELQAFFSKSADSQLLRLRHCLELGANLNSRQENSWEACLFKKWYCTISFDCSYYMQFTPSKICTSTRFQAVLWPHLPSVLHSVSHSLSSSSSSSQLLLYFTAIKPGNFNQVAQREFLQGHERSELLFNAVVLSFLFSFSTSSLFFSPLNSTLALYSL